MYNSVCNKKNKTVTLNSHLLFIRAVTASSSHKMAIIL